MRSMHMRQRLCLSALIAGVAAASVAAGPEWDLSDAPKTMHSCDVAWASDGMYVSMPGVGIRRFNGATWDAPDSLGLVAMNLVIRGDTVFICCRRRGLLRSVDGMRSWTPIGDDSALAADARAAAYRNLTLAGDYLLVSRDNQLLYSADGGERWEAFGDGSDSTLFVGSPAGGMLAIEGKRYYRSIDNAETWTSHAFDEQTPVIRALAAYQDVIAAGCDESALIVSEDNGASWSDPLRIAPGSYSVTAVHVSGSCALAALQWGGMYRSVNQGATWTPVGGDRFMRVNQFTQRGDTLFALEETEGLFYSLDEGQSWRLYAEYRQRNAMIVGLARGGASLLAIESFGAVHRKDPGAESWGRVSRVRGLVNYVYDDGEAVFCCTNQGLFATYDSGESWTACGPALADTLTTAVRCGASLFVGGNAGLFRHEDGAADWQRVGAGIDMVDVRSLGAANGRLFAHADRLYRSEDGGTSWTPLDERFHAPTAQVVVHDSTLFAFSLYPYGPAVSYDLGDTWRTSRDEEFCNGAMDYTVVAPCEDWMAVAAASSIRLFYCRLPYESYIYAASEVGLARIAQSVFAHAAAAPAVSQPGRARAAQPAAPHYIHTRAGAAGAAPQGGRMLDARGRLIQPASGAKREEARRIGAGVYIRK